MNNKMSKLLAIVLCVVMMLSSVAAVTADSLSGDADAAPAETAAPAEGTPSAEPADPAEEPSATDGQDPAAPAEEPSETDGEDSAPAEEPVCTCEATEEEKAAEDFQHQEGCPLYAAPVDANASLYEKLMAAASVDEFLALTEGMSEEEAEAFAAALTDEQLAALKAHIAEIAPEEETAPPQTVTFTQAGPFMPAVTVETARRALARAAAPQAEPVNNEGLETVKTATVNEDGIYTVTIESWATGSVTTETKTMPVDIVLVLDQSGSMAYGFDGNSASYDSSRQKAMQDAVIRFIGAVNDKYSDDADHRMAIVTFGSSASTLQGWTYVNASGKTTLSDSISGLPKSPSGATNIGAGMNQAESLMGSGYNYSGSNNQRQKVVIVFTDGVPTTSTDFDTTVANNAISSAKSLKDSGVTVYSIGIFTGANPDQLYGAEGFSRNSNGTVGSDWSDFSFWSIGDVKSYDIPAGNRFLNYLSSNYAGATGIGIKNYSRTFIGIGYHGWEITQNFERTASSYYLTADNANALNGIFQTISANIQTPSVTLGSEAVLKDIVSPSFTIPENATVTVQTADKTANGWRDPEPSNLTAERDGKTVSVSGFDYSANFVSETQKSDGTFGKKLIVSFTVVPEKGFLGGNSVPTNAAESGIYNKDGNVVENFPLPTVDVPIKYTFESQDQSIYLGSTADLEKLYVQDTTLDGENNAYVDITYYLYDTTNRDSEGNETLLATMTIKAGQKTGTWVWEDGADKNPALTEDNKYAISSTVKPIYSGTYEEKQTDNQAPEVYVFKPEVTFKDSEIFLGETANYADNTPENNVAWKHKNPDAPAPQGDAPELSYTYSPVASAFTEDTDVEVTVWIGDNNVTKYTSFVNNDDPNAKDHQFTVEVKSGTLTITKDGNVDKEEGFIFNVYVNGVPYTTVSVKGKGTVTLSGLPAGTYSVTEDTGWSWRYMPEYSSSQVTINSDNNSGEVTVTNTKVNNNWLGGEAYVRNVAQTVSTGDGN